MKKMVLMVLISSSFVVQLVENFKFYGMLILLLNCMISYNQMIEVKFGNMLISKIDGVCYVQNVLYEIICDLVVCDDMMIMILILSGFVIDFNQVVINISVVGLGIEFWQND